MKIKKLTAHIFLSFLTGLAALAAVPKTDLFFLMYLAFIPLIFISLKSSAKQSFLFGLLSGFIFYGSSMYWLPIMLKFNTGAWSAAFFASFLLWLYLSLYWALWSFALNLFRKIYASNFLLCFFAASLWAVLEFVRTYFLTGFPWLLLGHSQYKFTQIIQIAEWCGVYGISFLIILCNALFYFWIVEKRKGAFALVAFFLIAAFSVFGAWRTEKFQFYGTEEFDAVIVQPNIEQDKKWDKNFAAEIWASLHILADEIAEKDADIAIFPESVIPHFIDASSVSYADIKALVKRAGVFSILGAPFEDAENGGYFNSVFSFEKDAEQFSRRHNKNHLVPFGEFVPFRKLLAKFVGVLNELGDFEKGSDAVILSDGKIYAGALICSENFFPNISRRLVLNGAKVLTNHTNDAWFFNTAAPHQHFIMNIFRAVENRKAILVSANTGISGIIEASGRITAQSPVFERGLIKASFLQNDFKTFYTRKGDIFISANIAFICLFLFLIPLFKYREVLIKWIKSKAK